MHAPNWKSAVIICDFSKGPNYLMEMGLSDDDEVETADIGNGGLPEICGQNPCMHFSDRKSLGVSKYIFVPNTFRSLAVPEPCPGPESILGRQLKKSSQILSKPKGVGIRASRVSSKIFGSFKRQGAQLNGMDCHEKEWFEGGCASKKGAEFLCLMFVFSWLLIGA